MDHSRETLALLEEIRDLQKEQLAEYREQAARSIRIAEKSVARQKAIGGFYKKVVIVAAILTPGLLALLWWMLGGVM